MEGSITTPETQNINDEKSKKSDDSFDLFCKDEIVEPQVDENETTPPVDLSTFISENYDNKIGILTPSNYRNARRPLVVAFHQFNKYASKLRKWTDLLMELAQRYNLKHRIEFFVADFEDMHMLNYARSYSRNQLPLTWQPLIFGEYNIKLQTRFDGKAYWTLKDFCSDLLKRKVFISEPLPLVEAVTNKAAVKIAVGDNFQELVEDIEKDVLITFHTKYNSFCRRLLLMLDKLSMQLSEDAENLSIIKIQRQGNHIPLKYEINYCPTIIYIPRNNKENLIYYYGPYTVENLKRFIAQNASFELTNYDPFDLFCEDEIVEPQVDENDTTPPVNLKTFLSENYNNKIGILTPSNYKNVKRPLVVAFHQFNENAFKLRKWIDLLVELSQRYNLKDRIRFFVADFDDGHMLNYDRTHSRFNYDLSVAPVIFGEYNTKLQIEFNGNAYTTLKDFCSNLLKRKVFFSEPLPLVETVTNKAAVKIAVGDNFQELVEDVEKDVFITFYTDWSSFCKEFLPRLDELSILLSDDAQNLSIIKINRERNYIPLKYCKRDYPTVMYIPRNNKENLICYKDEEHTIENLIKFIAENATFELTKYDRNGNNRNI